VSRHHEQMIVVEENQVNILRLVMKVEFHIAVSPNFSQRP
jgi:hypothetical protein